MAKCNFMQRARSLAEREMGCPLGHCRNGHHVEIPDGQGSFAPLDCEECSAEGMCPECSDNAHDGTTCEEYAEFIGEIRDAEAAAGWDPSP